MSEAAAVHPEPAHAPADEETIRRVQRTGSTSLSVTLPKSWTEAMHIRNGDRLQFHDLGGGRLEITIADIPGAPPARPQKMLHLDVRGAAPELLGRLVVGGFITGQDRVLLAGKLAPAQREEVARAISRLLGTSIVEESVDRLEVQNFIDPARYALPKLVSRMGGLLRAQLELCSLALEDPGAEELSRIPTIEDDLDQVYLVLVRQLLISSDDFRVAKDIGVPSHHFQLGYRVVAKSLEIVGDLLSEIGQDLVRTARGGPRLPEAVRQSLTSSIRRFDEHLNRTLNAFAHISVLEANQELNEARSEMPALHDLGPDLSKRVKDRGMSLAVQRTMTRLALAFEMLRVVNEITINKGVEPELLIGRAGGGPLRLEPPASGSVPP